METLIWIKSAAGHWLHCTGSADSIVTMLLSRSLRRLVACTAAVLFLACQGVGVALASFPAGSQSGAGAAQEPCHDAGRESGNRTGGSCHAQCQFQNASSTPSKVIYAATDLPAITVDFDRFVTVVNSAPPVVLPLARIEPPPHYILHCCLRN